MLQPGPAIRDSAGIQIVENSAPRWAEGKGWAVVDSPLVDIGGVAGDPGLRPGAGGGVVMLSSGRLAVVGSAVPTRSGSTAPKASHLATAGRQREWPRRIPGHRRHLADHRATPSSWPTSSSPAHRALRFGTVRSHLFAGGQAGANLPQGGRFSFGIPSGASPDGRVLAFQQAFRVNDASQGAYRDSADYVVYSSDRHAVSTPSGRFPGIEMEQVTMSFGGQHSTRRVRCRWARPPRPCLAGDRSARDHERCLGNRAAHRGGHPRTHHPAARRAAAHHARPT